MLKFTSILGLSHMFYSSFTMIFETAMDSKDRNLHHFSHRARYKSFSQEASLEVEIPLEESQPIDELAAHINAVNKIIPPFYDGKLSKYNK